MELQSILYPAEKNSDEEQIYFHRDGEWILFDGYLNLFYLEKHHKYCDFEDLTLELEMNGIKKIQLMHDRESFYELDLETGREKANTGRKIGSHGFKRYSFKLPYVEKTKGVFWFKILPGSKDFFCRGYYGTGADGNGNIKIAVNICTFKRERYVIRNMKALSKWAIEEDIDGKRKTASEHIHVFIVDNGRTLGDNVEMSALLQDFGVHLEIIPNANTGGTGGFSRGMKEAMDRREKLHLSHLLMMDDDAVFNPDIFVRLYGFLSTLKKEYEEITVGGALMREDYRYIQHASGEWFSKFKVMNEHPLSDMRKFETCTADWVTGTGKEHELYGAWWCCCYHMNVIKKENLPLPIFVHHDDIQFGMKQTERGIVFLNGICVWHQGFELVFPGVKQYYNMRNTLITMQMFEPKFLRRAIKKWSLRRYIGMMISYRYADCEFVYRGLMDFLRGKKWLLKTDPGSLHMRLMADYKSINPYFPLADLGLDAIDYNIAVNKAKELENGLSPDELRDYYSSERFESSLFKKISFNGWFLPAVSRLKMLTPLDSPWATYRYKRVCLYEPATGKGTLVKRSNREFFKGLFRILYMCIRIDIWRICGSRW